MGTPKRKRRAGVQLSPAALATADDVKATLDAERGVTHSRAKVVEEAVAFFQRHRLSMSHGQTDKLLHETPAG